MPATAESQASLEDVAQRPLAWRPAAARDDHRNPRSARAKGRRPAVADRTALARHLKRRQPIAMRLRGVALKTDSAKNSLRKHRWCQLVICNRSLRRGAAR